MVSLKNHIFTRNGIKPLMDLDIESDQTLTHKLRWRNFDSDIRVNSFNEYYSLTTRSRRQPVFLAPNALVFSKGEWVKISDLKVKDTVSYNYTMSAVEQTRFKPRFDVSHGDDAIFEIIINGLDLINEKMDFINFRVKGENSYCIDGLVLGGF